MKTYIVVVGNIGVVVETQSIGVAHDTFDGWMEMSKSKHGRASGETVTLMVDGEIMNEYTPISDSLIQTFNHM